MDTLEKLREPKYWLLGIGSALVALHLTVLGKLDDSELFATCVLFWVVIISLVWDKQDSLKLESKLLPSTIGALLIALILLRSLSPSGYHVRVAPLVSMTGLCLMASGFRGLRQYWKELLILSLLILSRFLSLMLQMLDLPTQTAKFSAFLLHYVGFEVLRQGVFISLPPGGTVQVYGACSGLDSILQMLNISVLFLMMVPLRWGQKIAAIVVAMLLGFTVNAGRVVLLAVLHAQKQTAAFDYWHEQTGSLIFSVISVVLFGGFCWLVFLREPSDEQDSEPC